MRKQNATVKLFYFFAEQVNILLSNQKCLNFNIKSIFLNKWIFLYLRNFSVKILP